MEPSVEYTLPGAFCERCARRVLVCYEYDEATDAMRALCTKCEMPLAIEGFAATIEQLGPADLEILGLEAVAIDPEEPLPQAEGACPGCGCKGGD